MDQTGVAILIMPNGKEKIVPLFSCHPHREADDMVKVLGAVKVKSFFLANNLLDVHIEDIISEYKKAYKSLPEDLMDELVSGFPFISGLEPKFSPAYYA